MKVPIPVPIFSGIDKSEIFLILQKSKKYKISSDKNQKRFFVLDSPEN